MNLEERVRLLEKETTATSVILKDWIEGTRLYRESREKAEAAMFRILGEVKTSLAALPCETRSEKYKSLNNKVNWMWGLIGIGGTAMIYVFINHIFQVKT